MNQSVLVGLLCVLGLVLAAIWMFRNTRPKNKYITVRAPSRFSLELLVGAKLEEKYIRFGPITTCEDGDKVIYSQLMRK